MNMQMPMTMNGLSPNLKQEIVKVNGENGARAYQMNPNSSALLLDESNPIVWLVQTDGAGYKTISPYTISPYQPAPPIDLNDLNERLKRLEEKVNESHNISNERKEYQSSANKTNVEYSKNNK